MLYPDKKQHQVGLNIDIKHKCILDLVAFVTKSMCRSFSKYDSNNGRFPFGLHLWRRYQGRGLVWDE